MSQLRLLLMAYVLIIEDEVAILMHAQSVLEEEQATRYQPLTRLRKLGSLSVPAKQLIWFSPNLKLGDQADGGAKVGELLRRKRPGIPVLYTSGDAATCIPFLPKPYTARALTKAVEDLVRG